MATITILILALCLPGALGALVALAARQKAAAYRDLSRDEAVLSRLALNVQARKARQKRPLVARPRNPATMRRKPGQAVHPQNQFCSALISV